MGRTIREVMAGGVVVARAEDTVGEVRERMSGQDIGALPVVDRNGVLVGIVTTDDLVKTYASVLPVSRVMSSPVDTLPPDASVRDAARRLRERRRHHVVVAEEGRVVGMLSTFDLLSLVELHG